MTDQNSEGRESDRRLADVVRRFLNVDELRHFLVSETLHYADALYGQLRVTIQAAREELEKSGDDRLLVVTHVLPSGEEIILDGMGYRIPDLILLFGQDVEGNRCVIATHAHSVQLVLRYIKPTEPEPKRPPIGFRFYGAQEESTEAGTEK